MAFTFGIGSNQTIGNPFNLLDKNRPRRMVFYGRVSTEHEAQLSALENQIQWYDDQAKYHPNWTVVDKYIDEGITGTQAKKRPAFLRMIEDARKGKFDLIVTREVCRFARNTVDTLVTTRELKGMGIEVYFVEDNIWTMDGDGELRLTIMATLAQEESRKVSERVKAGQMISREKKTVYGNGNILGYNRSGSTYVINEEQAETVRMIYSMYVDEKLGTYRISDELTRLGRKNASGLVKWPLSALARILANPTYMGYQAYGKSYSNNYLEQKRVNVHDHEKYMFVKAEYEPIVSEETWKKADEIRKSRVVEGDGKKKHGRRSVTDLWASKLKCRCGSSFRKDHWHKNKGAPDSFGYVCYNKINNGRAKVREAAHLGTFGFCDQPMIADWKLDLMGEMILDQIWGDRKEAVNLAFDLIKESYQRDIPTGGTSKLPRLVSSIDLIESEIASLTDKKEKGEISLDEYILKKAEKEVELSRLRYEYEVLKTAKENETRPEMDWDGLRKTIYDLANRKKNRVEILRRLIYRVIPEDKTHYRWYINLSKENEAMIDMECDGRKNNATVNISTEGTEKRSPQPLYDKTLVTLRQLGKAVREENSPLLTILHRQLSVVEGSKLYLSFIVDYAQAKAFRAKKGYNQAPKHWEDIRVEVFIQ